MPQQLLAPHQPKTFCQQQEPSRVREQLLILIHEALWLPDPGNSYFWRGMPSGLGCGTSRGGCSVMKMKPRRFSGNRGARHCCCCCCHFCSGCKTLKRCCSCFVQDAKPSGTLSIPPQQQRLPCIPPPPPLPSTEEIRATLEAALSCTEPTSHAGQGSSFGGLELPFETQHMCVKMSRRGACQWLLPGGWFARRRPASHVWVMLFACPAFLARLLVTQGKSI